ncbi:sugar transport protein 4-like [Malania oleifera]|uniref:sugar transport protein 4-like n=1 Tax=Malania oleifera TaxID=397392 RepID=UPI0025AE3709|nr:sugar transport protein 4-like [Malania oleifera]
MAMLPIAPVAHQRLSRRWIIFSPTLLLFVGVVISVLLPNTFALFCGRILMGFGAGVLYQVIPMNIFEIESVPLKKNMGLVNQFGIMAGNLLGCVVNYYTSQYPDWDWMGSFGSIAIFNVPLLVLSLFLADGSFIFRKERNQHTRYKEIFQCLSGRKLIQALAAQGLPHAVGMDTLSSYMPVMLEGIGVSSQESYLAAMTLAGVSMLCSIVASVLRRTCEGRGRLLFSIMRSFIILLQLSILVAVLVILNKFRIPNPTGAGVLAAFMLLLAAGSAIITAPEGCLAVDFSQESNTIGTIISNFTSFFFYVVVTHVFFFNVMLLESTCIYFLLLFDNYCRCHFLVFSRLANVKKIAT